MFILGHSAKSRPIVGEVFGSKGPSVLILGGVHGNETEGTTAALGLLECFSKKYEFDLRMIVIPQFNIDGVLNCDRLNGNGVDLNRNLPTKDWNPKAFNEKYPPGPFANSEPENKALVKFLENEKPKFIISLHSWKPMLNVNGDCVAEAEAIQKLTNYEIVEEIGYPTPGCLGTYAGIERNMPTLTYEIERGLDPVRILKEHVPALLQALKVTEKKHS